MTETHAVQQPPGDIKIRRARPDEAAILTDIAFAAKRHWQYPESYIELWRPELTFTADYIEAHAVYVALDGERPVGVYALVQEDGFQELDYLWVLPAYIGQGVGRRLVRHALAVARTNPLPRVLVASDPYAVGFYEKMGFRKIGHLSGQPPGRILPVMEVILSES